MNVYVVRVMQDLLDERLSLILMEVGEVMEVCTTSIICVCNTVT